MLPLALALVVLAASGYVIYRVIRTRQRTEFPKPTEVQEKRASCMPESLPEFCRRVEREGIDFVIQRGRELQHDGVTPRRFLVLREYIEEKVPLANLMRCIGYVARLNGQMRGQCPACSEFGFSWSVIRERDHFECESCNTSGGSFEYLLLCEPRLRVFLGPGYEGARMALLVKMFDVVIDVIGAQRKRGGGAWGPGGSSGNASRRDPTGPWRPRRPGPQVVQAVCERTVESEHELVAR